MNWLRMSPVNSPLNPSSTKTLPANRPNLVLRNCVNVAFMSAEVDSFGLGSSSQVFTGTIAPASRLHAVPEAAVAVDLEEPARPEAQLAGVDIERVVGVAVELPAGVLAATHDALRTQEDVGVEHHALLAELVAQPPPAAGEPWPIPRSSHPRWAGRRRVAPRTGPGGRPAGPSRAGSSRRTEHCESGRASFRTSVSRQLSPCDSLIGHGLQGGHLRACSGLVDARRVGWPDQ